MSLQEKKAIFNIFTSTLILGGYAYYVFILHAAENIPQIEAVQFWAKFILTMIVVTIVLKIIIHILFHILYKIITQNEEDLDFMDEHDKQIEMKSDRNGNYIFILGFIGSMIPVAMGKPVYYMFIIMLLSGFISGTLGDLWKIYYYRKGI